MKNISKSNISTKLNIAILLALFGTNFVFGVIDYAVRRGAAYEHLQTSGSATGKRLKNGLVLPMWNMDEKAGGTLVALEIDPKIISSISVRQSDGRVFAARSISQSGEVTQDTLASKGEPWRIIREDILHDDEVIGTVSVSLTDHTVKSELRGQVVGILLRTLGLSLVISLVFFFATRSILVRPLRFMVDRLHDIALGEGDLTRTLPVQSEDEIGQLAENFNLFVSKLRSVIGEISGTTSSLDGSSKQLLSISDTLTSGANSMTQRTSTAADASREASERITSVSNGAETMSQRVTTVASSIEEMNSSLNEVARNCQKESEVTATANQKALSTQDLMKQLEISANEIGKIIDVIDDIADQTNLLALNATIEAASAGDAGKGFGVVANEVKELAKQTARATTEIVEKIDQMQSNTKNSIAAITEISEIIEQINIISQTIVSAVEEQSATIAEVASNVNGASSSATEIAANVSQSAQGLVSISESIDDIDNKASESLSSADSVKNRAQELANYAESLAKIVHQFKI